MRQFEHGEVRHVVTLAVGWPDCDDWIVVAKVCWLRGELLNATGDPSAAERSYHQAIAVAKLQSAKPFELRASINLAHLWCKQDRRGEVRNLLAPIYGWFTEGFDTPDLREAKALLNELHD